MKGCVTSLSSNVKRVQSVSCLPRCQWWMPFDFVFVSVFFPGHKIVVIITFWREFNTLTRNNCSYFELLEGTLQCFTLCHRGVVIKLRWFYQHHNVQSSKQLFYRCALCIKIMWKLQQQTPFRFSTSETKEVRACFPSLTEVICNRGHSNLQSLRQPCFVTISVTVFLFR